MEIVGSKDQVYPGVFGLQSIDDVLLLHHTATDRNDQIRSVPFDSLQLAQCAEKPLIGVVPYAAGVDNDHIGPVPHRIFLIAQVPKHTCQGF